MECGAVVAIVPVSVARWFPALSRRWAGSLSGSCAYVLLWFGDQTNRIHFESSHLCLSESAFLCVFSFFNFNISFFASLLPFCSAHYWAIMHYFGQLNVARQTFHNSPNVFWLLRVCLCIEAQFHSRCWLSPLCPCFTVYPSFLHKDNFLSQLQRWLSFRREAHPILSDIWEIGFYLSVCLRAPRWIQHDASEPVFAAATTAAAATRLHLLHVIV